MWDKPEDIEWEKLPDKFVLKTTHGGGSSGVVICKDKTTFDIKKAIASLNTSMSQDIYRFSKEWPYKDVHRRVLAEKYVEGENKDLPDYKFFCFDGEVKGLFVATDRQTPGTDVKFDFFDSEFNYLPFLASKLSKGIPHVRVDFYDLGNAVLFGELTFFHFSGTMPFEPREWDYRFGEWLTLPREKYSG